MQLIIGPADLLKVSILFIPYLFFPSPPSFIFMPIMCLFFIYSLHSFFIVTIDFFIYI
jgi:hypothetical protein